MQNTRDSDDEGQREPIDALEIFEVHAVSSTYRVVRCVLHDFGLSVHTLLQHLRDVTDPEHPYTLEQLNVVSEDLIKVEDSAGRVRHAQRTLNLLCQHTAIMCCKLETLPSVLTATV